MASHGKPLNDSKVNELAPLDLGTVPTATMAAGGRMLICAFLMAIGLIGGQHGTTAGMAFDQSAAVHHFLIESGGGTISVGAKHESDAHTRMMIREHLKTIADDFARGDFSSPLATHGEMPPGVKEMQRLKADLHYTYQETPDGGSVVIRSGNARAITAVHQFLAYQIREHKTGDPMPGK
jgi:hypothetical protein